MTQTKTLKNIIVIIIILVVVTLLGFYFLNRDNPMENTSYTPHRGTLTGVQTCLHKE
jgi:Na+/proline symporter